ncbi:type ISP restriction/modification enzyme [Acrocarpospora catenulata]|uniref:type ISP restriction/modification enzyme n=1 Tax=Acrocarpospora catenulata TaxID=2836182 RepID=UPI001BD978CA|nr:type ISP restriction/modification enzyme [Acrocarpospora catenulata]
MQAIHATGEAVKETSYYGQLEGLLNQVGKSLSPAITCVLTTKNRGAGLPDGGLFIAGQAVAEAGDSALLARAPERGVVEAKGPSHDIIRVSHSAQIKRYLERYGKILVCTYRDFLILRLDSNGVAQASERFTLAADEESFWALDPRKTDNERGADFVGYLERMLWSDAPLSSPADLAGFLAAYARTGLKRVEATGDMQSLSFLQSTLEEALGLRFEDKHGDHFFRSALVQTLFYGVFAAWVFWAEKQPEQTTERFAWRQAQWTLPVPMVRVLFQQLTTPANLPVGLDEVLDWTDDVLARVDRKLFFQRFEAAEAVQSFYEPFLQAYDPGLRRELGVWYTPPEVVHYMVASVDQALRTRFGLPLGLADPRVHVLDPCTGTGSYLTAILEKIVTTLKACGDDGLIAADVKEAALSRIHGFELLPAPFVIAHLQLGLALQRLGVPLDAKAGERASVYLTNALTGWVEDSDSAKLPFPEFLLFPEFAAERNAARAVKRNQPILVVLGNPPYNGFAGVSGKEEGGLIEPYKEGLAHDWNVTKNKLDDLYIRFFRIAERRIAEQTGKGIICFVTNSSWLGDPSAVVMRKRLLTEFDDITIDHLNGDSRETGKKTPAGDPDPSIFSTKLNPAGITRGVAISTLIRVAAHTDEPATIRYRDFWGQDKREQLAATTAQPEVGPAYEPLAPDQSNWFRLLRWRTGEGYTNWPAINELCSEAPMLGLNENRQFALIDSDRDALATRIRTYLNPNVPMEQVDPRLSRTFAGFDPEKVRRRLLTARPFDEQRIQRFQFRPLDMRYAYVETVAPLWNRSRPLLVAAAEASSGFLLVRRRAPRVLDGATLHFSDSLVDQKVLFTDAYAIPFWLSAGQDRNDNGVASLFDLDTEESAEPWRPNLSDKALTYLRQLGIDDAKSAQDSATLIWFHALAIGVSPLYGEQNGEAVRSDWPRIPLPNSEAALRASAAIGRQVAALLNLDEPSSDVASTRLKPFLRTVAVIERIDGKPLDPGKGDLAVTAGWGIVQQRAVMPGAGKFDVRERDTLQSEGATEEESDVLGTQTLDIYLNVIARWRGVPAAVWDYKIGGFQVLRKWLSYRDKRVLGRDLTLAEAREFTNTVRRLTALVLLAPELDANYRAALTVPGERLRR